MPESPKFGMYLNNLSQAHLDAIVGIYERVVNPGLHLKELLGEHPLRVETVYVDLMRSNAIERRWDGSYAFRVTRYDWTTNNPLINFSFEHNLRSNSPTDPWIKRASILQANYERAVAEYLLERGLAEEII